MKNLKKENGAITIITLVSVLFMVSFLISSYILISNKVKTQKEMLNETKKMYESTLTMEEVYDSYFNNENVIPIYTIEQLFLIGTNTTNVNVNGTYYDFINDENVVYILMNNLQFKASDYSEYLTDGYWIPIWENSSFSADFESMKHTIKVIYDSFSIIYQKDIYSSSAITRKIWTQNEDGSITDGLVTLQIGDYINYNTSNETYTSPEKYNGCYDQTFSTSNYKGGWRVLGVEDGCLQIISADAISADDDCNLALEGRTGFQYAEQELNAICGIYGQGDYATGGRSITVEDVNKITGYDPSTDFIEGEGEIYEYGNKVTYTTNGTEFPSYYASNGLSGRLDSNHPTFYWYDFENEEWKSIDPTNSTGEEITTLICTIYWYEISDYIDSSSNEYNVLCYSSDGRIDCILNSYCVFAIDYHIGYGMYDFSVGSVSRL